MRKITRRSFLSAAAVCGAAAALTACGGSASSAASSTASSVASTAASAAADGKSYTIGICQLVEHAALDAATQGFEDALTEQFGDNVKFDFQNAQNDSATCATIANGFVSASVDLIMANATPALQAAQAATNSIPILGTSVTEYGVALGLTDFDGTVGGNVSGTSDLAPLDQQAEMITEWLPDAKKVGLLYCSAEANSQYQVDEVQKYLEAAGVTATQYSFSDSNDLASVCQKAADENDAVYVPTDNTCAANTGIIDGICRPAKKPVFAGEEGICSGCGVATLSISYYDLGYTTGEMAAKILTGEADISEMPIEYTDVTKKYNKTICEDLGLTVPEGYEAIEWRSAQRAAEQRLRCCGKQDKIQRRRAENVLLRFSRMNAGTKKVYRLKVYRLEVLFWNCLLDLPTCPVRCPAPVRRASSGASWPLVCT